jgi:DNA-binding phage protein
MARAERDPAFRAGLYQEAVQAILDGELGTAKILLRDFINATLGFAKLARRINSPEKLLMRMFGPNGNPRAENLVAVVRALKEECGLSLTVRAAPQRRRTVRTDCERTARKWPSYKGFRSIFGGVDLNAITPAGAILSADQADRHWCAVRHAVWVYTLEGILSGTAFEKLRMGTGVLKLGCRYGEAI